MLLLFLWLRSWSGSCSRHFQWIGIGDADHFCETAIVRFTTGLGLGDKFAAEVDVDPSAGFDPFFVVLSDTGNREGYSISLFCDDHQGIGGKRFYFSL